MRRAKGAVVLFMRSAGPARSDVPQKESHRRGRRSSRMGTSNRMVFSQVQVERAPNAASARREVGRRGVGQMEHFEESTAGRFLTLAMIVPLAAGASVTWDAGGAGSIVIMGSVVVGIVLATIGGAAALESRVKYAIAAALAFPPALLVYFPLV